MGAEQFICFDPATNPDKAFRSRVKSAQYAFGHAGYTGTIAEKDSYVIIQPNPLPEKEAQALAQSLLDAGDPRIDDKWGPAGALPVSPKGWLFFGWASS